MSSRHPRANRECRLGEQLVAYQFQRAARRTIGLSVGPQGLSVRAPHWTPLAEVDALLLRKADWVLAKLRQLEQASRLAPAPTEWRSGAVLPCLGRSLVLELCPDPSPSPDPGPGLRSDGLDAALAGGRLRLALARDAGLLVHQAGYRCTAAGAVNMFPHTAHVESVAVFERVA